MGKPKVDKTTFTPAFPVGSRVLVDYRDEAIVKASFPEGSSSNGFPHYKLDFVDGDKNVTVAWRRVGGEYEIVTFERAHLQAIARALGLAVPRGEPTPTLVGRILNAAHQLRADHDTMAEAVQRAVRAEYKRREARRKK